MSDPELATIAEGVLPSGQRWILRADGTREDFYTFLETAHPDGHSDEGGMGGELLCPGQLLNTYCGCDDRGLLRVVVRADPRVARLRLTLATDERLDLAAVATDPVLGVSLFAALLPRTSDLVSLTPSTPLASRSPRSSPCAPSVAPRSLRRPARSGRPVPSRASCASPLHPAPLQRTAPTSAPGPSGFAVLPAPAMPPGPPFFWPGGFRTAFGAYPLCP